VAYGMYIVYSKRKRENEKIKVLGKGLVGLGGRERKRKRKKTRRAGGEGKRNRVCVCVCGVCVCVCCVCVCAVKVPFTTSGVETGGDDGVCVMYATCVGVWYVHVCVRSCVYMTFTASTSATGGTRLFESTTPITPASHKAFVRVLHPLQKHHMCLGAS